MEIEQCPQVIAKRMWKIVRIVFYMLRKSFSKRKLILDLQMMFKQGKLLGKSIENLVLQHQHHYAALTCRPDDVQTSFISPREYEFSCSNTPIIYPKKRHHHHHRRRHHHHHHLRYHHHQENDVIEKVVERLNNHDDSFEASPLVLLPGFGGGSPMVKQLRVTDSPFSIKEMEDDPQVDKDAEEFIKKFYMELNHQKRVASFESPSPCHNFSRRHQ
ncbi:hypothetical protein LIER_40098 [Lithospermum erythrorhizon]|uniref:Avr9/Cf-9 rapidly elicited protein n=1 Tax=Lithospermum erythrorhizon TaxID=34254 RepID=A0AAV3QPN1_LITER